MKRILILLILLTFGCEPRIVVIDPNVTEPNECVIKVPTWRQVIKAQHNTVIRTRRNLEAQENRR